MKRKPGMMADRRTAKAVLLACLLGILIWLLIIGLVWMGAEAATSTPPHPHRLIAATVAPTSGPSPAPEISPAPTFSPTPKRSSIPVPKTEIHSAPTALPPAQPLAPPPDYPPNLHGYTPGAGGPVIQGGGSGA